LSELKKLVKFFEDTLSDSELLLDNPIFLKKFLILYNRIFLYSTFNLLEKNFTPQEVKCLNFQEFKKIFKKRNLNDFKLKKSELTIEDIILADEMLGGVYVLIKKVNKTYSPTEFFFYESPRIFSINKKFSEIACFSNLMDPSELLIFEKNLTTFLDDYNCLLKVVAQIFFLRVTLIKNFFTLKKFPLSQFYLFICLLTIDDRLRLFLIQLNFFKNEMPLVLERLDYLSERNKRMKKYYLFQSQLKKTIDEIIEIYKNAIQKDL
jgi:hypothetical protein